EVMVPDRVVGRIPALECLRARKRPARKLFVQRDAEGRIRFHYTLVDFAAEAGPGEPVPGDDCAGATWAPLAALHGFALWERTLEVIARAARLPRPIG
ncbi:MAG: hypothetical protein ACK4ST_03215, partial [Elioraea tepidiphila]